MYRHVGWFGLWTVRRACTYGHALGQPGLARPCVFPQTTYGPPAALPLCVLLWFLWGCQNVLGLDCVLLRRATVFDAPRNPRANNPPSTRMTSAHGPHACARQQAAAMFTYIKCMACGHRTATLEYNSGTGDDGHLGCWDYQVGTQHQTGVRLCGSPPAADTTPLQHSLIPCHRICHNHQSGVINRA